MDALKKPNIRIPEGFELFFNSLTGNWALRPIIGYSQKYLKKNTFVPKKPVVEEEPALFTDGTENNNETIKKDKSGNSTLTSARKEKYDEFYTRLEDITEELKHYKSYFEGKIIYCPCDKIFNLGRSNFAEYFMSKFHKLGLKKLICTQYNPNGHGVVKAYDFDKCGIKWEYNGEEEDGSDIDESMVDTYFLKGDGSFDSFECREIMKSCDIVITNPPFSLFRKFLAQIMEFNKKFIIIGNMDAITYKDVFPLLKENKIWLGYRNLGSDMFFEIPDDYKETIVKEKKEGSGWRIIDGEVMARVAKACWFTNLEHSKRHEEIYLSKTYNPTDYPRYDKYDAIFVKDVKSIPVDYDGVMAVPCTFLGKYNPDQFELVDARDVAIYEKLCEKNTSLIKDGDGTINGKAKYAHICIKKIK